MLEIEYERNRINEIGKQRSGLIAVRDAPSTKGSAIREENWESRLPNPIAIVGTTKKCWKPPTSENLIISLQSSFQELSKHKSTLLR
ncbi:hypothetical protein E3N88_42856 [Mikania micrantha]|uniref:Uncharacterized protein n=1 Tax=Mikania micrantha TaxID=192012 RepID=A0A5N6LGJ1_9ASTR|nr:hypothetical protein E3N88_42856 [Mikania micrantha]